MPLQPLPRIRLLKVSVFISTAVCFYKHMYEYVATALDWWHADRYCEQRFSQLLFEPQDSERASFSKLLQSHSIRGSVWLNERDGFLHKPKWRRDHIVPVLVFRDKTDTKYVKVLSDFPALPAVTACAHLQWDTRTQEIATIFSYAVPAFINEFQLRGFVDEEGFVRFALIVHGHHSPYLPVFRADGQWHHFCVTWQQENGTWAIYADGKRRASASGLCAVGPSAPQAIYGQGTFIIGQDQDSLGGTFREKESFSGNITDLHIWQKVLGAEQIEKVRSCWVVEQDLVFGWSSNALEVESTVQEVTAQFLCPGKSRYPRCFSSLLQRGVTRTCRHTRRSCGAPLAQPLCCSAGNHLGCSSASSVRSPPAVTGGAVVVSVCQVISSTFCPAPRPFAGGTEAPQKWLRISPAVLYDVRSCFLSTSGGSCACERHAFPDRYLSTTVGTAVISSALLSDYQEISTSVRYRAVLPSHLPYAGGMWSTAGCSVVTSLPDSTTCFCNHTTNFAVLLQVYEMQRTTKEELTLQTLTFIGCGVSFCALIVTFILFVAVGVPKSERTTVHKNLIFALAAAEALLMFSELAKTNQVVCFMVTACLHLFFMAAFSWMLVEGLLLWSKVVAVNMSEDRRMKFYYVTGWGLPVVIVGVTLATSFNKYVADNHCWLNIQTNVIWAFVGPVLFILAVNTFVLFRVVMVTVSSARRRSKMLTPNSSLENQIGIQIWATAKPILVLLPVLGLTWVCGVLVHLSIIWAYVFIVLNSLQFMLPRYEIRPWRPCSSNGPSAPVCGVSYWCHSFPVQILFLMLDFLTFPWFQNDTSKLTCW
uniref:Adhesion G protein-coupled receptor D2 n=1 Tax=Aquila chrysaetos chrysaetos TaxID=223781 RepID=A0A663FDY8_AQUCH